MADELDWPIKEIPDADSVFRRAHRNDFRDGELEPGVFRAQGAGMSVNWDRYASAEETRQQARKHPHDNAVISMPVGGIRQIDDLRVEHTPEPTNQAHSDVHGLPENRERRTEVRVLLLRITTIVLPLTRQ
ncbi:MAG: hypothetical protein A3J28_10220 [Acidobacteria bacterium RIFCSPLOWO2_12_FULL_60_22]|nr:MAG: hypothetical protein A3J28_10220 [Acidobacteria bacterium RIFCSPLOWO2_12_FULL_60_22]